MPPPAADSDVEELVLRLEGLELRVRRTPVASVPAGAPHSEVPLQRPAAGGVDEWEVLPAEADTAPLATLRALARGARAAAGPGSEALPPPAPWAALRAMLPRP